ncbi:MAG: right-handed parallel beta-helix repeat-containing protein [Parcubacteria group bacterium]|nr:right-handed parallel beta-helix repeat-containing protein [Parcubacteria group bacterium]
MKGSTDEDHGTRALQHFYDPVYNRGLTIGREFQKSREWAGDTLAQASYAFNAVSIPLSGAFYGTVKEFYSSETDHSWERAIYEYTWGDKKRGLESLGHILHLIQDASVPDHTRNDPHPPVGEFGSPFEAWTAQFTPDNFTMSPKGQPVLLSSLDSYFDSIAKYSNNNFFSQDTISNNEYSSPIVKLESGRYIFHTQNGDRYPVGYINRQINLRSPGAPVEKEVFLVDPEGVVLVGYWSHLSQQVILHGAGVIKLFFDEVEKERKTGELKKKNRNWLQKIYDATAGKIYNLAMSLYGGSVPYEELVPNEGQTAALGSLGPNGPGTGGSGRVVENSVDNSLRGSTSSRDIPNILSTTDISPSDSVPNDLSGADDSPSGGGEGSGLTEGQNQKSAYRGGYTGGSSDANPAGQTQGSDTSTPADTTAPEAPVIQTPSASPWQFTATSANFAGTAEASSLVTATYLDGVTSMTGTTTTSLAGAWNMALTLGQGTTTVSFTATDAANNVSSAATTTGFVDSLSPDISLTADTCTNTLATSGCLVATTTLAFSWSSSATDFSYYVLNQNGVATTTTATTASVVAPDGATYTFSISAIDIYGNQSATSTADVEVSTAPVVINEVAWMGTQADPSDEWIELYNQSDKTISLTNWVLYSGDLAPYIPLSGTIAAGGYYLIERTGDTTITDITADITTSFGGVGASGLANGGETLSLVRVASGATTTMDYVPMCSNNWCAGINTSALNRYTMERVQPDGASSDSSNWASALGEFFLNGTDVNGNAIKGTPKSRNSVSYLVSPTAILSTNKTLTASSSPYLVGRDSLTIASGVTLTLNAGVVVKLVSPNTPSIVVNGALIANGTADNEVVFTPFEDDTYGGDMNGDATSTTPSIGTWKQLKFTSSGSGSSLNHTRIRYGGQISSGASTERGMLLVDGTDVAMDNVITEYSAKHGLALVDSGSQVQNSTFQHNDAEATSAGVSIVGGSPTITDSTFTDNSYGLLVGQSSGATITDNTFTENSLYAVYISGTSGTFSGNTGSGNGENSIVLASFTSATSATTTLAANPLSYRIENEARVISGSALAFGSGTVIKGTSGSQLTVENGGTLFHSASSVSDLIFTSVYDDSVGSDVTSATTSPAAGNWARIDVEEGGVINLSGFTLRYGGGTLSGGSTNKAGIKIVTNATSTIANALIEHNLHYGMRVEDDATLQMSNTTIRNHTEGSGDIGRGMRIRNSTATLSDITFSGNDTDIEGSGTNVISCTNCGTPVTEPPGLL